MFRLLLIVLALGVVADPAHAAAPACSDYAAGVGRRPAPFPVRSPCARGPDRRRPAVGRVRRGVGVLDLDDPVAPDFSGFLPTSARSSGWPPTGPLPGPGRRRRALVRPADGRPAAGLGRLHPDRRRRRSHRPGRAHGRAGPGAAALLLVDVSDPSSWPWAASWCLRWPCWTWPWTGGWPTWAPARPLLGLRCERSLPGGLRRQRPRGPGHGLGHRRALSHGLRRRRRSIFTYDVSDPPAPAHRPLRR